MPVSDFQYMKEVKEFIGDDGTLTFEKVKEAGPLNHSYANLRHVVDPILKHPECTSWEMFIGGKGNFRYDIDPEYKGQRDPINRPIHEKQLRNYLVKKYNAIPVDGQEADDEVSILCCESPQDTVIVSIDKDLNNTSGWHYNYDKKDYYFITEEEADLNFYRQLLTGDATDHITGIKGCGKATALKILPEYLPVEEMAQVVWNEYKAKGYDLDYMTVQGQLLWMRRKRDEMWEAPIDELSC